MKINVNSKELNELLKFLEGGAIPPESAPTEETTPPAPQEGGDPMELILQAAAQAVQTQDGLLALQVCQALVEMAGGGAPQEAPAAPEGLQPVYRKGGKLSKWILK